MLVENLNMEDAFTKFCRLNKNFYQIFEKLKTFPKLWKIKFCQEFISERDQKDKTYASLIEQERFFSLYNDHQLKPGETTFQFFKRSIE